MSKKSFSQIMAEAKQRSEAQSSTLAKAKPKVLSIEGAAQLAKDKRLAEQKRLMRGGGFTKKPGAKIVAEQKREALKVAKTPTGPAKSFNDLVKERPELAEPVAPKQPPVINIANEIKDNRMSADIKLDPYQQAAIEGLREQQFGCLIGAAGTGKTTALRALVKMLHSVLRTIDLNTARKENQRTGNPDYNISIAFCAFTGRAVQQMKRALAEEYHPMCDTIHGTLGYTRAEEEYFDMEMGEHRVRMTFVPTFTEQNKLPFDIIVIDEGGMTPIQLFDEVEAARKDNCRVYLVGDLNQLPPVQGRSVLGFAMLKWPTFALEKLHRNAGPIAENAHRILQGKMPKRDEKSFAIIDAPGGSIDTLMMTQAVVQKLHKAGTFNPMEDTIIVPQNVGTIGQMHLNERLVKYFNPPRKIEGVLVNPRTNIKAGYQVVTYAIGDKVMLLQNDRLKGLTNGMVGVVVDITKNDQYAGDHIDDIGVSNGTFTMDALHAADSKIEELKTAAQETEAEQEESERAASHIMRIKFQNVDEEVVFATSGQYKQLAHAYASTCHKAQGGEYPTVVIVLHSANLNMLSREWFYTAVTRAQKRVILVANHRGLVHALNCQRIKGKTIAEKAKAFLALQDKRDTRIPNLPDPVSIPYKEEFSNELK